VSDLASGFEPVDEMEVEVVAAGTAAEEQRRDRDESGQGKNEQRPTIFGHEVRVTQRALMGS
jgi:hypothetical protein